MREKIGRSSHKKKSRLLRQCLSLVLAVALLVSVVPIYPGMNGEVQAADAFTGNTVQPVVVVSGQGLISGGTYTAGNISNEKSYTLDELKNLEEIDQLYSAINTTPTRSIYLGKGISIEKLLQESNVNEGDYGTQEINVVAGDGYTVKFDPAKTGDSTTKGKPLKTPAFNVNRYYYPNIKDLTVDLDVNQNYIYSNQEAASLGGVIAKTILAWEKGGDRGKPEIGPTATDQLAKDEMPLLLMLGQQNVWEQNNPLFNKTVSKLLVGEAVTTTPITIDGTAKSRSEILMMERADRSYTYTTKKGDFTDYARGVPLAVLVKDHNVDEVISFTAADGYDMSETSITVADAIANNYMLAYEKGTDIANLKAIYSEGTLEDGVTPYQGYFTVYGDGAKPLKLINSISIKPAGYVDYSNSHYKHINNGGKAGSAPYNIDAITGATLTVEGPGVEATTPIRMGDLEATSNTNIYRGNYTDNRGPFSYEGVKVLSIIDGLVNTTVEKVDENVKIVFKNRWRQNVGSINYNELKNAITPVILAYGTGTSDEKTVAPFVFDKALGIVNDPALGNDDGCVKLVYDKTEFSNVSDNPKFASIAYVYVERSGERPGFKHSEATNDAYKNTTNMEHFITFTGSKLGYEVNYTVAELEAMVKYNESGLPLAGGLGHRADYGLSNTTYWYVNEYEGIKLWDLLTTKLGLNAETYRNDNTTLVSFAAWDNYKTNAQFSMAQLADPDLFSFYEKSPLDLGTNRPTKAQLGTEEYQPDNAVGEWTTDTNGYPVKKGYPVMLAYGVNGYPYVRDSRLDGYAGGLGNDGGPMRVIFGKADDMNRGNPSAPENYAYFYNNGTNQLQRAQEIYIGDNLRYSTHMENPNYSSMKDNQALTVDIIQGGTTSSKTYTLAQLESILYGADVSKSDMEKQGRKEKGYYAHKLYNNELLDDLFEGVNIWYLLSEDIGMQGTLGTVSLFSGDSATSSEELALTDIQQKGFNSTRNTEKLGSMLAFAKNGYPMVLDKNSTGYVNKHSDTDKIIKNSDGPLMFVQAQTAEEKATGVPGKTVKNLTKIVVNLEADVYAHTGDYSDYGNNEVAFTGAVKNAGVTLKVSDIEKLQKFMVTDKYTVGGVSNTYRGIDLNKLLSSSSIGASALLSHVVIANEAGKSKSITVSDIRNASKSIILAYGIGKEGADPVAKPFVPDVSSTGYEAEYTNTGGPLKLIIDGGAIGEDCIENVTSIEVLASELTGWTHSTGYYEAYKNNTLDISGTNISKNLTMTVQELETLSETYKVFDKYQVGNEYYYEGIDLLKLLRDHIGFNGGLDSSNITVYAKDDYAINFSATDLTNGVNNKPLILAYGQGVSADNGLPLVDGDDSADIRNGFDSNIGNAFGPLRLIVNDNAGWCNKWVTKIVVGSSGGGGGVSPPVSYNFTLKNKDQDTGYDIRAIKSITEGLGGKATANYKYTSKDESKTDYVKGVYLADLLKAAGISGGEVKVTINTSDAFENKQDSYRDISLADLTSKNYFLAYDAGETEYNLTPISDEDKQKVVSTVRVYRNFDDGSGWLNRLTNIKGITVSGLYTFKIFEGTGDEGALPAASVREVVTDANGGIWVGTNGGGAWYKPAESDEFTINTLTTEGYKLASDLVYAVAMDDKGGIWFTQSKTYNPMQADLNKGVAYLKDGIITYYNTSVSNTIPNNYVQDIKIDDQGNVWFGSFGGLTKYDPTAGTWTTWDETDGFPARSIDNLLIDGQGGIWCGFYPKGAGTEADPFVGGFAHMTADGVITSHNYTAEYNAVLGSSLLAQVWIRDIAMDNKGGVWAVASGSYSDLANVGGTVWYVDNKGEETKYTGKELLGAGKLTGNSELRMVEVDSNGGLWFGTSEDGLFYVAKPGKTTPLTVTAQYNSSNQAWPNKKFFDNIYVLNIIGENMYLGSNAGIMYAPMKDIAVVPADPIKIETFTISGVGSADIPYYVGGSGKNFKGLPNNAGKVSRSYLYDGVTHYVTGALLSTLLADASVGEDYKITINTSDGYSKSSYKDISYTDLVAKDYFVAYDVGEGTETKGKVADTDDNSVTASYRIYRNLDTGAAGSKDNRIKGVVGITVSKAGGGGGVEVPVEYDLTINGNGVSKITGYSIKQLKNAPGLKKEIKAYSWLNSYGTTGSDEFEGVYLENLLQDVVGLTSRALSITVTASDGYYRSFNLDSSPLGVYWTDIEGNKIMLAWKKNGTNCDLQLVVGQTDAKHINKTMWVSDIVSITVNASSTNSGTGSPNTYNPPGNQQDPTGTGTGGAVTETINAGVNAPPTINGGTSSSNVPLADIKKALEEINKTKPAEGTVRNSVVEINAASTATSEDVTKAQVTLSAETINALVKGENVTASIKTDLGTIVLSPEVLQQLTSKNSQPIVISITVSNQATLNDGAQGQIGDRPVVDITFTHGDQQITNFGGNQIRAGISYNAQSTENQSQLLAYYINDKGESAPVKLSRFDGINNQMLFGTVHLSLYAVGYNDVTFTDILSHWAKNNIQFLAAREIIKGKGADAFDPDGNVTRAEFVTMLANSMDGITVAGAKSAGFDDVAAGSWYADYVNWAVTKGIVSGYGDGNYGPNDMITREQMALMTDNFIKAIKADLDIVKVKSSFTDQAKISSWSAEAIIKMQQSGIINGRPDGSFAPQGTSTRAEAATVIKGYIDAVLK